MNKTVRWTVFAVVTVAIALVGYTNCSSNNDSSNGGTAGVNTVIAISPQSVTLNINTTQQFTATGGTGVYTYSLQNGVGSISTAGLYTAASTTGTATVQVVDTAANVSYASVTVVTSGGGTGGGTTSFYSCPVHASQSCSDASRCQSTCIGQYSTNSTCTWYSANAVANIATCTPVTTFNPIFTCPVNMDQPDCADASQCESTCMAQLQSGNSCIYFSPNAVVTNVSCSSVVGTTQNLYSCGIVLSSCTDMSRCESDCLGQITTSPTCTTYYRFSSSYIGTQQQCSSLGSYSF